MYSNQTIVDLASRYTALTYDKISGKHFGTCPFCHSKLDVFSADKRKGYFFCYACGARGDRKEFLEKIEPKKRKLTSTPKDPVLLKIYEEAAFFYYENLQKEKGIGYAYFAKRNLTAENLVEYGLGFAPDDFSMLYHQLRKTFKEDDLMRSGLFKISKKGYPYDFFRNRVMFPIMDENGDVIAFGGRVLDDSKPKYINSPETELFCKRKYLYGFPYESEQRKHTIIICEGYMDYIAIHKAGFTDCAAVLGVALTEDHAKLISQYYDRVCLALDSDDPGVNATRKSIKVLQDAGLSVTVPDFKPAKDPDEFINRYASGYGGVLKRIEMAVPAEVFLARHAQNIGDIVDILIQQT